jgi:zinc protease
MLPGNGAIVIVGDVRPDAIAGALESRLREWSPGPVPSPPSLEPIPAPPESRQAYLINKDEAAQSVIAIGRVGAPRKSPDFHALIVMNAILGGQFASRINLNLRQEKGYSYGAESGFAFYRGPGPIVAGGPVESRVTKEALQELFKELEGIAGARPVTDDELSFAKERLILGFPGRFETTFGVAGQVAVLIADELPDDEFERYQPRIEALSKADVDRVAKAYITPDRMVVLIVGDRAKVEGPIKTLPWAREIRHLDTAGHVLDSPFSSGR